MAWRLLLGVFALDLAACGKDCRKLIQSGDFEFSQGNYPRAITLYDQALKAGGCSDAQGKKQTAESMARPASP